MKISTSKQVKCMKMKHFGYLHLSIYLIWFKYSSNHEMTIKMNPFSIRKAYVRWIHMRLFKLIGVNTLLNSKELCLKFPKEVANTRKSTKVHVIIGSKLVRDSSNFPGPDPSWSGISKILPVQDQDRTVYPCFYGSFYTELFKILQICFDLYK